MSFRSATCAAAFLQLEILVRQHSIGAAHPCSMTGRRPQSQGSTCFSVVEAQLQADPARGVQALDQWEERLEAAFDGRPYDILDAALTATVAEFPVSIQPFRDMIGAALNPKPQTPNTEP